MRNLGSHGGGVKGGDEAVGSVVAFDRARDEAGHVQSRIAQDVQQVGEYAGAGDQRDEGDDGFEVAGVIAVGAGVEFLDHITRGDDKEFGVRAIEILHMFGEGVEIVEFAADAGAERHAAGLQVAAGGGVGGCGFGLQMVFGDEPGALGQTVRVGADGVAGAVVDAVAAHGEGVEGHVHTDPGEAGRVGGVDQRVEIRDHIAFDVVFPCDDAPALARLYGLHDRGHVGQSDEVEVAECGELVGGRHCRLMGEGALRAQVKQFHACHKVLW